MINRGRDGGRSSELIGIVHGMRRAKNAGLKPRGRNYRVVVTREISEGYLSCAFLRLKWLLTSRPKFFARLDLRRSETRENLFPMVRTQWLLFFSVSRGVISISRQSYRSADNHPTFIERESRKISACVSSTPYSSNYSPGVQYHSS